jgi:hypothetical protein
MGFCLWLIPFLSLRGPSTYHTIKHYSYSQTTRRNKDIIKKSGVFILIEFLKKIHPKVRQKCEPQILNGIVPNTQEGFSEYAIIVISTTGEKSLCPLFLKGKFLPMSRFTRNGRLFRHSYSFYNNGSKSTILL